MMEHIVYDSERKRMVPINDLTVETPLQVRLGNDTKRYVVTLWRDGHGIVCAKMTDDNGAGSGVYLSVLQMEGSLPTKAVPGWQSDALRALATGLREITEVV